MFRSLLVVVVLLLSSTASETFEGSIKVVARSLEKCGKEFDLGTCLRMRAVSLLDQALKSPGSIVINDFLSLAPDPSALENDTHSSEKEMEKALTDNSKKKDELLDDMIADRMTRYLNSRSLKFSIPAGSIVETGRKKGGGGKKKGGMMMMAAVAMGGWMIQMMMGKVAMMAGKALLVGKMALLLSVIISMKKMMGGGGGDSHPQVVYATESHGGGGGGGGWGRSIDGLENTKLNQLAYRRTTPRSSYRPVR